MEKKWIRRSLFILPIVIALAVLVIAPKLKRPPEKAEVKERAAKVRAIKVPNIAVLPRAVGYGTTMPARSWEAVAEVAGQVSWLSDELKSGKIVQAGSELLQINDASYQLALTQAETQLQALAVKERTTRSSLALEEKSQALLEKDIARKLKLRKQGAISSSVFEEAERSKLKGESTVQGLKNTLALNAAEREVLKTQVANARLDLERTRLVAPFDARITEVKVGQAQYANRGQLLFSADATDSVEIEARFPIGKLRPLIAGKKSAEGEDVAAVERTPGALKLDAVVRLKTATHTVEWEARVDRVSGVVDPQTQTLGVVVVVDEPYAKARPGQRHQPENHQRHHQQVGSGGVPGEIVDHLFDPLLPVASIFRRFIAFSSCMGSSNIPSWAVSSETTSHSPASSPLAITAAPPCLKAVLTWRIS
ncbi:MAG: HlyD family efflux transporter periplasmic adaptor subunit, partial [Candidatus Sedimenticola sp. 6PFRAG1]